MFFFTFSVTHFQNVSPILKSLENSPALRESCHNTNKKGRDKRYTKNWRPISLLNIDTKLISKVVANRIKKVIGLVIAEDQTAYVPGSSIGESIRLILDLPEYT